MSFTDHQKTTIKNAVKKVFGEENITLSPKSGNSIIKYELGSRKKSTITYTTDEYGEMKVKISLRLPNCPVRSYEGYLSLMDYERGITLYEFPMTVMSQAQVIQSILGACI